MTGSCDCEHARDVRLFSDSQQGQRRSIKISSCDLWLRLLLGWKCWCELKFWMLSCDTVFVLSTSALMCYMLHYCACTMFCKCWIQFVGFKFDVLLKGQFELFFCFSNSVKILFFENFPVTNNLKSHLDIYVFIFLQVWFWRLWSHRVVFLLNSLNSDWSNCRSSISRLTFLSPSVLRPLSP